MQEPASHDRERSVRRSIVRATAGLMLACIATAAGVLGLLAIALAESLSRPLVLLLVLAVGLGAIWARYFWRRRKSMLHPALSDLFKYLFDEIGAVVLSAIVVLEVVVAAILLRYAATVVSILENASFHWRSFLARRSGDFFLGAAALQNYLSEIVGILITVLVVDKLIRARDKRRDQALRDTVAVLLYEMVDTFIRHYLPPEYIPDAPGMRRFGDYWANGGVYLLEGVTQEQIVDRIERLEIERWENINWPWTHNLSETSRAAAELELKLVLQDIKAYGARAEDFMLKHHVVLDKRALQALGLIRYYIVTAYSHYYEPLKPMHAASFGVDIHALLPKLVIESLELNAHLERSYGHDRPYRRPDKIEMSRNPL